MHTLSKYYEFILPPVEHMASYSYVKETKKSPETSKETKKLKKQRKEQLNKN